ncbi:SSU ribosomal protein S6p [Geminocystis sp. NIES-3708]|uniref:30S ribosomal protein S6 n=1 Tax=Geminocystis sp. NIES-3708 TaxID=1615909 RepID=UPI0005FC5DF3|nr:30S ribosomal protein S6 [Geminocystis sp. NIES-3708]BAQ60775.1 SSU ribosomal protein S6p [Geminocystis sp. NIES-3708]
MSNTYEMMFILRPDLTHEQVNKQLHKYRDLLKQNGAEKVSVDVWGKRRLAYPIQKFLDGIYILTHYTGDGSQVALIERDMRLSETVIRYLTIKLDKGFEFEEKDIPELQSTPVATPVETTTAVVETEEVSLEDAPVIEAEAATEEVAGVEA